MDNEGEHWNSYLPVPHSTLLGKGYNQAKLHREIVEHPFGTIKRGWGAYYFLTRRKVSVSAEISLSFLAYNLKRVINILGTEEILKRLRQRGECGTGIEVPVLLSLFFCILLKVKGDSLTLSLALIKEYIAGFHTV